MILTKNNFEWSKVFKNAGRYSKRPVRVEVAIESNLPVMIYFGDSPEPLYVPSPETSYIYWKHTNSPPNDVVAYQVALKHKEYGNVIDI